ncbi:head-tail adaptor protein [Parablautia muri]|uniref:Head-tail adaptor protein n=1 Tax=Parablautia muri TaxID=2320879 RepID=A0A9X5GTP3_9FIRM|nr:hypothetical protein [Parablautia muri]NBJ93207.1 hypothetical protein [Parablautia muri]
MKIGGNCSAIIQVQDTIQQNSIGEDVPEWKNVQSFKGWLDLSAGDSNSANFNAKVQESTHIFLCDYFPLQYSEEEKPDKVNKITPENSRMIVEGSIYEVTIYDDPMNRHEHLEIYLKYVGGC